MTGVPAPALDEYDRAQLLDARWKALLFWLAASSGLQNMSQAEAARMFGAYIRLRDDRSAAIAACTQRKDDDDD